MPPSAASPPGPGLEAPPGQGLAVAAESLYLANLLLLPGLAFVALAALHVRAGNATPVLARAHLKQTFSASLWAGGLLVVVNLLLLALGGYRGPYTWLVVITYFIVCHSTLILFGMLGLAKAMAGQCYRFPVVGRPLPPGCGDGQ